MAQAHSIVEGRRHPKDDLKLIHGIGPALEKRLNDAGIVTYGQLSNTSNKELAEILVNIPGFSEKRISEEGWKNQAQHLMKEIASSGNKTVQSESPHSEVFSLDLLLNNQNNIIRTHILHVQSMNESSWAGWSQNKLANFVLENAVSTPPTTDNDIYRMSPDYDRQEKTIFKPTQKAKMRISGMDIQATAGKGKTWLVHLNEPFDVGIILDLSDSSIPSGTKLSYQIEVHAKDLANGSRKKIAEIQGIATAQNFTPIAIPCSPLPEGSYRLEACAIILPGIQEPYPSYKLMAMTEGKVFRVS